MRRLRSCELRAVRARPRHRKVNALNKILLRADRAVALCCGREAGNIWKQKSVAERLRITDKGAAWPRQLPTSLSARTIARRGALIAKSLRTNACNVTTATDGREMTRAMADHRIDLLIL